MSRKINLAMFSLFITIVIFPFLHSCKASIQNTRHTSNEAQYRITVHSITAWPLKNSTQCWDLKCPSKVLKNVLAKARKLPKLRKPLHKSSKAILEWAGAMVNNWDMRPDIFLKIQVSGKPVFISDVKINEIHYDLDYSFLISESLLKKLSFTVLDQDSTHDDVIGKYSFSSIESLKSSTRRRINLSFGKVYNFSVTLRKLKPYEVDSFRALKVIKTLGTAVSRSAFPSQNYLMHTLPKANIDASSLLRTSLESAQSAFRSLYVDTFSLDLQSTIKKLKNSNKNGTKRNYQALSVKNLLMSSTLVLNLYKGGKASLLYINQLFEKPVYAYGAGEWSSTVKDVYTVVFPNQPKSNKKVYTDKLVCKRLSYYRLKCQSQNFSTLLYFRLSLNSFFSGQ